MFKTFIFVRFSTFSGGSVDSSDQFICAARSWTVVQLWANAYEEGGNPGLLYSRWGPKGAAGFTPGAVRRYE